MHLRARSRALLSGAVRRTPTAAAEAVAALARAGIGIADFSLGQPSLDEVFLALTGHPAEAERATSRRPRHERRPQRRRVASADEAAVRSALSTTPRPPRASALAAALTFGWRGMLKVKHVPEQLLDVTITPVMFVLMFTYLFGGAISGSTGEYLDYILPGILVMSVLFTTVYSGVALNTDLTKGVVDRFRSLPIWRPAPLVGALLGDSVRYVIAGTVIIVLGVILGFRPDGRRAGRGGGAGARAWCSRSGCRGCSRRSGCCMRTPERGDERRLHGDLPAHVPEQRVRRPGDAAGRRSRRS